MTTFGTGLRLYLDWDPLKIILYIYIYKHLHCSIITVLYR